MTTQYFALENAYFIAVIVVGLSVGGGIIFIALLVIGVYCYVFKHKETVDRMCSTFCSSWYVASQLPFLLFGTQ